MSALACWKRALFGNAGRKAAILKMISMVRCSSATAEAYISLAFFMAPLVLLPLLALSYASIALSNTMLSTLARDSDVSGLSVMYESIAS
jgi:hypothetical protein